MNSSYISMLNILKRTVNRLESLEQECYPLSIYELGQLNAYGHIILLLSASIDSNDTKLLQSFYLTLTNNINRLESCQNQNNGLSDYELGQLNAFSNSHFLFNIIHKNPKASFCL